MKAKLLTLTLVFTMIASFTACGTGTSTADVVTTTAKTAEAAESVERAEWGLDDIAALSDIVTGIMNREYAAMKSANYVIYEDISYDHDIVYTVLFNTASVRFDTPGEYNMTYWIYFDTAALAAWADENGVDLDIPDADRLAVSVYATVTITAEDELSESDEDTETDEADTAVSADSSTTTGSAKSASGTSSNASKSTGSTKSSSFCSHNWVATKHEATGHYESVLVTAAYDEKVDTGKGIYQCNTCGFQSTSVSEIGAHARANGCSGSYTAVPLYETVHHDAVYETQWVEDSAAYVTFQCSKCGATK